MKTLFHWGRDFLKRVELLTQEEDLAKKTEIPEASSAVQRLKAASDKRHERRKNILDRLKGRHEPS